MIKTTASALSWDEWARHNNVQVVNVPVGFKEIANIMNNAIEGWKQHGTHRFGKEYGIQRSWKRTEGTEKKDKDGFMEVPEQLEIPFE